MARPNRIFQSEHPYHLFNRTNNKEFLFNPTRDYEIFEDCLRKVSKKTDFRPHHFELVYNHFHLEATTPKENIGEVMHLLQLKVSKYINRLLERSNHIFGSRYGATVVKSAAYQSILITYIYNNSTKIGLVKRPGDYPYGTLKYYLDGSWRERGFYLDPYLEAMSDAERRDYLLKLNRDPMDAGLYEEFGKKLHAEEIL